MPNRNCKCCGNEIDALRIRCNKKPTLFCSAKCVKANWYRERNPKPVRVVRPCIICKNDFIPDLYHPNAETCGKTCGKKLDYKRNYGNICERVKRWAVKNKGKLRTYQRNYYWRNLATKRAQARVRKKGHVDLSTWQRICFEHGNKCNHCGKPDRYTELTVDHVRPISKGGTNDISNLQPLCITCNQSKGNRFVG